MNPIEIRYTDEEARALASQRLFKCILECRDAVKSLPPGERNDVWFTLMNEFFFSAKLCCLDVSEENVIDWFVFYLKGIGRMP